MVDMDWNKKKFIERFVQSVLHHGPSLVSLAKEEQGDDEGSVVDFLSPKSTGNQGWNYFRNFLEVSCPLVNGNQIYEMFAGDKEISNQHISLSECDQEITQLIKTDEEFDLKIRQFIASKADLLFSMEGKEKLRRGIDYGVESNQEVLDLYANTPPLETLMDIPTSVRRTQLLKCLSAGDIVIGRVASKRPFGIVVRLTLLEYGCNRDFTDLNIQALCKSSELDTTDMSREYKDPTDAYLVGDIVRGVIISVSIEEDRVAASLRQSRLPPEHKDLNLGVIDDPETVLKRPQADIEGLRYDEHLNKHKGFNNPRSIDTLVELLGVDTTRPCSLLRGFQRCDYPESDYAEPLRRKQSAKWSMETTAKGVDHFKAGNYGAAVKYFEHALQIDSENVEALVARGALCANQNKLTSAIKDFRAALAIYPSHKNAHRYLTDTLVEQGIQQEKEGMLDEARRSFRDALELDNTQPSAKENLEKVQSQIAAREQMAKTAAKTDKGLKSRFSHVRELIMGEQSTSKKKKKKKDRKDKKAKVRKKKQKLTSRTRHRSKRSSSSSESSSETRSLTSSGDSEVWVEKASSTATVVPKDSGAQEPMPRGNRATTSKERDCVATVGRHSRVRKVLKESETTRTSDVYVSSSNFTSRPVNTRNKRRKRHSSSHSSSSSRSPSSDRKKYLKRKEAQRKGSRNSADEAVGRRRSPRKGESRDRDVQSPRSVQSRNRWNSPQKGFPRNNSPHESKDFLEKETHKTRSKGHSFETAAFGTSSCSGEHSQDSPRTFTSERTGNVQGQFLREESWKGLRKETASTENALHVTKNEVQRNVSSPVFKASQSLRSRNQGYGFSRVDKPVLVSYDNSSDENSLIEKRA